MAESIGLFVACWALKIMSGQLVIAQLSTFRLEPTKNGLQLSSHKEKRDRYGASMGTSADTRTAIGA